MARILTENEARIKFTAGIFNSNDPRITQIVDELYHSHEALRARFEYYENALKACLKYSNMTDIKDHLSILNLIRHTLGNLNI